jgi:ArsR family transcriptional regulator, nickel/cobalt-responsive transcriptional repressor
MLGRLVRVSHGGQAYASRVEMTNVLAGRVASVMQALAVPSRVQILGCLRSGPRTVGELIGAVGMAQSAVSHQLRVLREMKLVMAEKRGRQVLYSLHDDHVASLLDEVVFHVEHLDLGIEQD